MKYFYSFYFVRYAFFRILLIHGHRLSFVAQTAVEIAQVSYKGPTTLMSYTQKTNSNVNKAWDGAKGPDDASSHNVDKSNSRTTQKLITSLTAQNFFLNLGEVPKSLRIKNRQSLRIFSHLESVKTALL